MDRRHIVFYKKTSTLVENEISPQIPENNHIEKHNITIKCVYV